MAESYDREIIRDLEKVPDDAHVAYQERKLGLKPFRSDTPMMREARETRLQTMSMLRELESRYWGSKASRVFERCVSELAQKDPDFWHEHRETTPTELLVIQEHRIKPFRSDAPLIVEAEKARLRVMTELHRMRWHSLRYMRTYEAVARGLKRKKPIFWFEHQKFRTEELLDMLYPGAGERLTKKTKWMIGLSGAFFILGYVFHGYMSSYSELAVRHSVIYSRDGYWVYKFFGEEGLAVVMLFSYIFAVVFLIAAIAAYVKSLRQYP